MRRAVIRLVLNVVGTVAVALGLLTLWFTLISDDGVGEGLRVLVNFMDVGLALWVVLAVVVLVRAKQLSGPRTYLLLVIGVVVNAVVVLVVGFVQGGWGPLLVLFAIQAGIACLVAAAGVIPIVHRIARGSPPS